MCPNPLSCTLTHGIAEFAFEIGSGLLTEVRRLQSLLGERDKAIQDIKEEKDDLEKTVESLRTALRQQEQSAGPFGARWLNECQPNCFDSQINSKRKTGTWRSQYRNFELSSPIP